MHDAGVVIGHGEGVDLAGAVAEKVLVRRVDHVLPEDPDVAVPVWSCLLVPEPNGVAQLMDQDAFVLTVGLPADSNGELLISSLLPNIRPAPRWLNIMTLCNTLSSMQILPKNIS